MRGHPRLIGIATAALAVPLVVGLTNSASAATTVVVTPDHMNGWTQQHYTDSTSGCTDSSTGSQSWVVGPGNPPAGVGSHGFSIGANGDSYEKVRTGAYDGTPLSDITSLSYSTYVSNNIDSQAPFLILAVDTNGDNVADDGLFFEPVYQTGTYSGDPVPNQGNVTLGQWQSWDVANGGFWTASGSGGPPLTTLAHYAADHPGATIASNGLEIAAGCGAGSWDNFVGNVDDVTIGVNNNDTSYDFEPFSAGNVVVDADGHGSPSDCNSADTAFTTVQAGVDFASAGDTVTICPGTYNEQVTVQKNVNLVGTSESGVVIKAPSALSDSTCVGNGQKVIVDICGGATVGLHTLTVAGPGPSSCGSLHYGVLVTGAATLQAADDVIRDVRDNPVGGCQNGIGLRLGINAFGQVGHGTMNNVDVRRYQKGGVVIDGAGTTGTLTGSEIAGIGVADNIASNGVQISRQATATLSGNSIFGNECDNATACGPGVADTESAGVLIFDAMPATSLFGNVISGNDMGIYNSDSDTSHAGSLNITSNGLTGNRYYGVFVDQGNTTLTNNLVVGPSNVGIEIYSFDGNARNTVATLTSNRTINNKTDVDMGQDSTGPGIAVSAHQNRFSGTGIGTGNGVVNHTDTLVDFSKNYWRTSNGPSDWSTGSGTKVSANVHFFPWYTDQGLTVLAHCSAGPTTGNDILCGTNGNDVISGGDGNDLILGAGGNDTLNGDGGNDAILGYGGDDTLSGGAGGDSIQGLAGADTCSTGTGPGDQVATCEATTAVAR